MRLKKIKLAGFKSFVEPTSIPFPGEMTAVVGPNGCGKSNVIDAVRWVLGESSAKNLRGDAMTDVIFNGSSSRKPVGQCSVELIFDNSSGRISGEYANYNELSVKRLVTREAQSTYFLNGAKCRRRDVTDLFLGTGLGPRSYAIIEQGMISRLIESKPQELRVFIEEAAGISKYKERRRETENRIKHTQDNLERLTDVRDELGRQLEKLQRQAAAATKYKALRSQVRELKGQLAAIRFLKNSEHIDKLEQNKSGLTAEMEGLIARQQGDEAGAMAYKEQQAELKQSIDDLQQSLFSTSTAITRLEQNALHAKQRVSQVEQEIARIAQQQNLLSTSLREAQASLSSSNAALVDIEPEIELKEAELYSVKERFEDAEQSLRDFNARAREQESTYNQVKSKVQQCHSQIQSLMSVQLRTSQRISDIQQELAQAENEDYEEQSALLDAQLEEAEINQSEQKDAIHEIEQDELLAINTVKQRVSELDSVKGKWQSIQSSYTALSALQSDASRQFDSFDSKDDDSKDDGGKESHDSKDSPDSKEKIAETLWQSMSASERLAPCIEVILNQLNQPLLANQNDISALYDASSALPNGVRIYSHQIFITHAHTGTLAHALLEQKQNERVPSFLNEIFLCETDSELFSANTQQKLKDTGKSAISLTGLWCGANWIVKPGDIEDGVLQRANKLSQLELELVELEQAKSVCVDAVEQAEQHLNQVRETKQRLQSSIMESEGALQQLKNARSLIDMQQQQQQARSKKLYDELSSQQALHKDEEAQLEQLSEDLAVHEAQLIESENYMSGVVEKRELAERNLNELRGQVEMLTSTKHELALKKQQLDNHQQLYREQVTRNENQMGEYAETTKRLKDELSKLTSPQELQHEELQHLLHTKSELEHSRSEALVRLEEVEQWLREAEKGQQSLAKDIQARQAHIDSLNIDIEGFRVRANTVLEQLDESKQSLKMLLAELPSDADETQWQQELEKTQASLQRLGAVNLAAVEEFEAQSQRKAHLDEQNNDLTDALETLQSAIRKIDKETRTRFSNTFEQVNEDLKSLFPKVFGGGSAYLALTEEDLLETGVTIMARPPGKKNSTIHLLSGGEKALTALSLVFAIFRLNPAPFCLLDEVDAPLDDANVGRFCNLVSEMSQTVQFIYITHNKIAMEMASHLTGVTMAEPGVSRMVAVDVDEAVAFAEA
ncbi:chromosome segregation protein SMC [Alteromonas sp. BMJM2]|uniref:chromosome segregation protein SMC n=1 Tax=Alteromonas sp. BMJM2 TaxID=2954241 RepID=UPI0022B33B01|nr:chromosome segregation protein SMC [Alteromonas sp. BMJM2]